MLTLLHNAATSLFGATRAPAAHGLHLANAGRHPVVVPAPAVVEVIGAGRSELLAELARQAIAQGWGLLYVSKWPDTSVWLRIWSEAVRAGRTAECFASGFEGTPLRDMPVSDIVDSGAILHHGGNLRYDDSPYWSGTTLLAEIADALRSRTPRDAVRPLAIVLDLPPLSRQHALARSVAAIADAAQTDVALYVGQQAADWDPAITGDAASCRVYLHTGLGSYDTSIDAFVRSADPAHKGRLPSLGTLPLGEAVIQLREQPTGHVSTRHATLVPHGAPILDATPRPANSLLS